MQLIPRVERSDRWRWLTTVDLATRRRIVRYRPGVHRLLWIGMFAACGSSSVGPRVVDAELSNLTDCQVLERVKGTASDGDPDPATHAKNEARKEAAKLGATHIRWIVPCCTSVEGDAYRCDLPEMNTPPR